MHGGARADAFHRGWSRGVVVALACGLIAAAIFMPEPAAAATRPGVSVASAVVGNRALDVSARITRVARGARVVLESRFAVGAGATTRVPTSSRRPSATSLAGAARLPVRQRPCPGHRAPPAAACIGHERVANATSDRRTRDRTRGACQGVASPIRPGSWPARRRRPRRRTGRPSWRGARARDRASDPQRPAGADRRVHPDPRRYRRHHGAGDAARGDRFRRARPPRGATAFSLGITKPSAGHPCIWRR